MPERSRTLLLSLGVTLLLAPALAGCGPEAPPASSPSPSIEASAAPHPVPSASESPVATAVATCENLISTESLNALTSAGLTFTPVDQFAQKMRDEGQFLALFVDNGGVVCQWGNGTSATEIYGFSPITEAQAMPIQSQLVGEGFTVSTHDGGALYSDTTGQERIEKEYLFRGGFWFCAITLARLDEVVAHAPSAP